MVDIANENNGARTAAATNFYPFIAAGALLAVMMWTAVLPPAGNPFMDDHLIYAAALAALALLGAGNTLRSGRIWSAIPSVQRTPWLRENQLR